METTSSRPPSADDLLRQVAAQGFEMNLWLVERSVWYMRIKSLDLVPHDTYYTATGRTIDEAADDALRWIATWATVVSSWTTEKRDGDERPHERA